MIIYVNGDSHSAGAEAVNPHCFAQDDRLYWALGRKPHPDNERASYGCTIANHLGAILHCDAESASSNDRIIRVTDDYIANNPKPDLIIIGWSTWEREEWSVNGTYYQVTAGGTDSVPVDLKERYKAWVIEQDGRTRTQKLLHWHDFIYKFHLWLESENIPHLFFNTYTDFSCIRQNQIPYDFKTPPEYDWNGCYIDPYNKDLTYYYWLLNKGFKTVRPESYHFGADAHRAWAEFLIQNYVQKLLTN